MAGVRYPASWEGKSTEQLMRHLNGKPEPEPRPPPKKIDGTWVEWKGEATTAFKQGNLDVAKGYYKDSMILLEREQAKKKNDKKFQKQIRGERSKLASNLALIAFKSEDFRRCIERCEEALILDDKNIKGYYFASFSFFFFPFVFT